MAENLNFNYLTSNQSYPDGIDSGNIYFKLVSNDNDNDTNNRIYNQSHSIEIALDLGDKRYFLTPKIATAEINGLLSKNDKEKIDAFANNYVNRKNFQNENNVNINLNESGSEPTGSLIFDENNQLQLNINIPRQLIKGEDGINGEDGKDGKNGDKGEDGITPIIEEEVIIEMSGDNEEPTAAMNEQEDNRYQLSLNFPDLTGEKGITPTFRDLNVSLEENIESPVSSISKIGDSDVYNIEIKLPKSQLKGERGLRGYQGPSGKNATADITIQSPLNSNVIDSITKAEESEANGATTLVLSGHYAPVIPKINNDNRPSPRSLLMKGPNNNDYNYTLLPPSSGFLEYNQNAWTFTTTVPISKGGTGLTSIPSNSLLIGSNDGKISSISTSTTGVLVKENNDNKPKFTNALPVSLGGTGKTSFTKNAIVIGGEDTLTELSLPPSTSNTSSALYYNSTQKSLWFGVLPTSAGGTGTNSFKSNAIMRTNQIGVLTEGVSISEGAFYVPNGGSGGTPQFSTLPVSCGGTGAENAVYARRYLGATRTVIAFNKEWEREGDTLEDYCLNIWNVAEFAEDENDPDDPNSPNYS